MREVVGVVVVGDPAADQQVDVRRWRATPRGTRASSSSRSRPRRRSRPRAGRGPGSARRTGSGGSGGRRRAGAPAAARPGRADHLDGLLARRGAAAGARGRGRGCPAGSRRSPEGRTGRARPRRSPACAPRRRAPSAGPRSKPPGSPRGRRRSRCSSWASRRARRGSGARAGSLRGPGAAGRGRCRSPRSAGLRRSPSAEQGRAELDPVEARARGPPVPRVALEDRAGRACASTTRNGPVPTGAVAAGSAPAAAMAVRPSVRSDGRIGTGWSSRMRTSLLGDAPRSRRRRRPGRRESPATPSIAVKAAGIDVAGRGGSSARAPPSRPARSAAAPSEKTTPGRRWRRSGRARRPRAPSGPQRWRREVALGVRRDEGLEDVGQDLVLLGGLVDRRLRRRDGVRHRDDERSAARDLFFGAPSPAGSGRSISAW